MDTSARFSTERPLTAALNALSQARLLVAVAALRQIRGSQATSPELREARDRAGAILAALSEWSNATDLPFESLAGLLGYAPLRDLLDELAYARLEDRSMAADFGRRLASATPRPAPTRTFELPPAPMIELESMFEPAPAPTAEPAPDSLISKSSEAEGSNGSMAAGAAPPNSPPGPPPGKPREPIRRFPHLEADSTWLLTRGSIVKVEVWADKSGFAAGEGGAKIEILVPSDEVRLQVWLTTSAHFEVVGPSARWLDLRRWEDSTARILFFVKVMAGTDQLEDEPFLAAHFSFNGRPAGHVIRSPLTDSALAKGAADSRLDVEVGARPADLEVRIVSRSTLDRRMYRCRVTSPHLEDFLHGREEDWDVPELVETLVGRYMTAFTKTGQTPLQRRSALIGSGRKLFEVAPQLFRDAFFRLIVEKKPLKSIAIVSAEPFLPWEILVPAEAGRPWDEPIGVRFQVSRWTSAKGVAPPQVVPFSDSHVLAPNDSNLERAQAEAEMVMTAFAGELIRPASIEGLNVALGNGGRSLLHYVGHGKSGTTGQVLILEKRQELVSDFMAALSGVARALDEHRPFVFLNACEAGRPELALFGSGGFAQEFMKLGASAVIAPLWSVKDSIANQLAIDFYSAVKKTPTRPFADILRELRARSFDDAAEDSWVAYVFYGDPQAACVAN